MISHNKASHVTVILDEVMFFIPNINNSIIIFGIPDPRDVIKALNYCILTAKFYIYKQRLFNNNEIDFYAYLIVLKQKLNIEQTICVKEYRPDKFEKYLFIYTNL